MLESASTAIDSVVPLEPAIDSSRSPLSATLKMSDLEITSSMEVSSIVTFIEGGVCEGEPSLDVFLSEPGDLSIEFNAIGILLGDPLAVNCGDFVVGGDGDETVESSGGRST